MGGSETYSWPRLQRKKSWFGRKDDVLCLDPLSLRCLVRYLEGTGMLPEGQERGPGVTDVGVISPSPAHEDTDAREGQQ